MGHTKLEDYYHVKYNILLDAIESYFVVSDDAILLSALSKVCSDNETSDMLSIVKSENNLIGYSYPYNKLHKLNAELEKKVLISIGKYMDKASKLTFVRTLHLGGMHVNGLEKTKEIQVLGIDSTNYQLDISIGMLPLIHQLEILKYLENNYILV